MFPTISHLIDFLFGVYIPLPIQSFGFMMALGFLAAAYTMGVELKRKEKQGKVFSFIEKTIVGKSASPSELAGMAVFGFIVGYKVIYAVSNYQRFVNDPQEILLSIDGNWIAGVLAAVLFAVYKYWEKQKEKLETPKEVEETIHPYQLVGNFTMIAAVSGLIGAKLFHNLENLDDLIADPVGALLSFSGLTFYGGLIFGFIAVSYYARKKGVNIIHLLDATTPGLMLAYAIGRIGCQLSGDGDWGIVNSNPKPDSLSFLPDWMWSFKYPHNVLDAGIPIPGCEGQFCHELAEAVYPTPFYETIMGLLIFAFLWSLRKRINVAGMLSSLYLVLNGIERFFIEKIRVNEVYIISGYEITQAEIISFCLIIVGIAGLIYTSRNAEKLRNI